MASVQFQSTTKMKGRTVIILLSIALTQVFAAKIVVLPVAQLSHLSQAEQIANALAGKGHDIHMILPDDAQKLDKYKDGPIKVITHHTPEKHPGSKNIGNEIIKMIGVPLKVFANKFPGGTENCRNILSDPKLHKTLRDIKPDIFVIDSFPFTHCVYVVPYRLGVPYVSFGTAQLPEWARSPVMPSFMPHKLGTPYTERMTFFERLDNLLLYLDFSFFTKPNYNLLNWVEQYAPEMPPVSLDFLVRQTSLWLVNNDIILEYPRALMPNEIFVGGLTTKPAKPLPYDLEKIVSAAQHGVIIMSFGSGLPDINSERFMSVFAKLKQVVLWRHVSEYKGDVPQPKNVHLLKWLPQGDLLGHNNTKLFITHGGSNGQFEALHHGVPMLAFPAFAEQPFNAKRMAYHGFGKVLDILSFTEGELELAIREILTDPSFSKSIKKASAVYRSRPDTPMERVTYWVDHVLKFGDSHLKSYAIEMPWYSFYMVDIFVFLAAVFIAFLVSIYYLISCCRRKPKTKKE